MGVKNSRPIHLVAFIIFLGLCTVFYFQGTGLVYARTAADEQRMEQAQLPSPTANSTAQAALREAVQTLQATPTEAPVVAAGGAPATATPLLLSEGPSAAITPSSGSANTRVTVTGGGFPANTRIDVYLAGVVEAAEASRRLVPTSYATTLTDRDGNYSISFFAPASWPDGAPVQTGTLAVLIATEDFTTQASASFDYVAGFATPTVIATIAPPTAAPTPARNPFAQITPLSGGGNTQVTVRGGGFPANTPVNVHLAVFDAQVGAGDVVRYGSAVTDGSGYFTLSFTMPATWPDGAPVAPGRLLILVATNNFDRQASAVFNYAIQTPNIDPYVEVQPQAGRANTAVAVRGGGFPANTRLELYLSGLVSISAAGAAPTSYASTTTDQVGNYRMSFVMPANWPDGRLIEPGRLALLVATTDFAVRASTTFDYLASAPPPITTPTWQGSYYDNPSLRNEPILVRNDAQLHFNWGRGSPDPLLPSDGFSASWRRNIRFEDGVYRFTIEMDDGARLYLNNQLILESWRIGARRILSVDYPLRAGEYTVRLDYFEDVGDALVNLRWDRVSGPPPTPTPAAPAADVLFDDDPRNNRRGVNQTFCSGFESECNFAGCPANYRLVWGPYCREGDYPYIAPGVYRVTLYGRGTVRAGATDFGATQQLYAFGRHLLDLPASFTFCWPGRQPGGYGFETIVQSTGVDAVIDRITIEYLEEECR